MSGGLADSVTIATPITNIDPIVINSVLGVDGSIGNGATGQRAFAEATGGMFSLGVGLMNLE